MPKSCVGSPPVWGSIACSSEVKGPDSTTSVDAVPDQHRAEPVGDRPRRLHRDQPARVGTQARSSNSIAPPLCGQNTYRQLPSGSQPQVCAPCSVSIVSSSSSGWLLKEQTTPG